MATSIDDLLKMADMVVPYVEKIMFGGPLVQELAQALRGEKSRREIAEYQLRILQGTVTNPSMPPEHRVYDMPCYCNEGPGFEPGHIHGLHPVQEAKP